MASYDFLRSILGDELFAQVAEKLDTATGVTVVNANDGTYIPKGKYDDERTKVRTLSTQVSDLNAKLDAANAASGNIDALNAKIEQLKSDVAERDGRITAIGREYRIKDAVRGMNARNADVVMKMLALDKITEKDGKLEGLEEQIGALKQSDAYLFANAEPPRFGVAGMQDTSDAGSTNVQMNAAIRQASGRN